jgi:hypothetical protein
MTNNSLLEELLTQYPRLNEIDILLSDKNLSEEDLQIIKLHRFIAETIAELPKERIPESLSQQLYTIELKSYKNFAADTMNDAKRFFPYFIVTSVIIVLLNSNLIGVQTAIQNIIVLSVGCTFVFYQLLKSKFFIV